MKFIKQIKSISISYCISIGLHEYNPTRCINYLYFRAKQCNNRVILNTTTNNSINQIDYAFNKLYNETKLESLANKCLHL